MFYWKNSITLSSLKIYLELITIPSFYYKPMIIQPIEWGKNKKNEENFELLFERYHLSLLVVASHFVPRTAAEDIIQDVFLKLWEKRKELDKIESVKDYLYSAVKYGCFNYIRSQAMEQRCIEKITDEAFEEVMLDEEVFIELSKAITELPESYRKVIELSLEGKHADEIAQIMGVTRNAVNAYKKRAKSSLKKKLSCRAYSLVVLI